jgi:choloylglycine hydrolase
MRKTMGLIIIILFLFGLSPNPGDSCTVFRLKSDDGTIMIGRSMEFAVDLKYDAIVVPRDKTYTSPAPGGQEGLTWKTRYGYVGIASFGLDYGLSDGMNEKGLAIGLLWYETDMKWQEVTTAEREITLAQAMVGDWILGNFSRVEEVKQEIRKVKVFQYTDPKTKISPTVHFIVYDAEGGCIVIEYEDGLCNIYDNPLGLLTNGPRFPWQLNQPASVCRDDQ